MAQHNPGTSSSWTSPSTIYASRYLRIQNNAVHLGILHSPHFPKTLTEYMSHVSLYAGDMAADERKKLAARIGESGEKESARRRLTSLLLLGGDMEDGSGGEEELVRGAEVLEGGEAEEKAQSTPAIKGVPEQPKMKCTSIQGRTSILSLKTSIWCGTEQEKPEGKRHPLTGDCRAYWPDTNEFKTYGQMRREIQLDRRLPKPKIDMYSEEMLIRHMGDLNGVSDGEIEEKIHDLERKTGEAIAPNERLEVSFTDEADWMESINALKEEDERHSVDAIFLKGSMEEISPDLGNFSDPPSPAVKKSLRPAGGIENSGNMVSYSHALGSGRGPAAVGLNRTGGMGYGRAGYGHSHRMRVPKMIYQTSIAYGADGYRNPEDPPPEGFRFDEGWLRHKGAWKYLLEEL